MKTPPRWPSCVVPSCVVLLLLSSVSLILHLRSWCENTHRGPKMSKLNFILLDLIHYSFMKPESITRYILNLWVSCHLKMSWEFLWYFLLHLKEIQWNSLLAYWLDILRQRHPNIHLHNYVASSSFPYFVGMSLMTLKKKTWCNTDILFVAHFTALPINNLLTKRITVSCHGLLLVMAYSYSYFLKIFLHTNYHLRVFLPGNLTYST